jgi:hypothetical protein
LRLTVKVAVNKELVALVKQQGLTVHKEEILFHLMVEAFQ